MAGVHAALNRRTIANLLEPALEIFELADVLPLGLGVDRPRIGDHVGDRVLVAGQIATVVKPIVHDAVEAVRLVGKATDRVGQIACLGAGSAEMAPDSNTLI